MVSLAPNFWSRWKEKRCVLIHSATCFYESCWAESEIILLREAHCLRSNWQKDEIMEATINRSLTSPNLRRWRSQRKSGTEPLKKKKRLQPARQEAGPQQARSVTLTEMPFRVTNMTFFVSQWQVTPPHRCLPSKEQRIASCSLFWG